MIMSNDDNDSKDKKNMAKNPLTSEFSNDLNFLHRNSFNFLRNLLEELFYMCWVSAIIISIFIEDIKIIIVVDSYMKNG